MKMSMTNRQLGQVHKVKIDNSSYKSIYYCSREQRTFLKIFYILYIGDPVHVQESSLGQNVHEPDVNDILEKRCPGQEGVGQVQEQAQVQNDQSIFEQGKKNDLNNHLNLFRTIVNKALICYTILWTIFIRIFWT